MRYNGNISYLFPKKGKIYDFKAKDSSLNAYLLCFGNFSKNFTIGSIKKIGLNWCVHRFLVDLVEKYYVKWILDLLGNYCVL